MLPTGPTDGSLIESAPTAEKKVFPGVAKARIDEVEKSETEIASS